ncbi:MAG: pantoate--beta-alanine ligase [Candidatus Nanopelagicales bacterium]
MTTEEMRVVRTREAMGTAYGALPAGTTRAAVLTMGALHDGHAALIRQARSAVGEDGHVTVTIFVNPLQFQAGEDLGRYPRTSKLDIDVCAREGADLVLVPPVGVVYRKGEPTVTVDPGPLGTLLEGAMRPGHFRGMLTVVHKLLGITGADLTFFGEKDYQQLVLVRRMVGDLDLPVLVAAVPTVRDDDGLALSTRNGYLTDAQRVHARAVPRAVIAGREAARRGVAVTEVVAAAHAELAGDDVATDYVVVTDPDLGPAPERGPARLLVAVRVGDVRLLDNCALDLGVAP